MNNTRTLVCLYSDANFFALSILENLLSKGSQVIVATQDLKKWEKITSHLINKARFSILNFKNFSNLSTFGYSIFCGGFISKDQAYTTFNNFISWKNLETSKRMAILPFECFTTKDDGLINTSDNLSVVYIGDLLGPRIDLDSDLLVNRSIAQILIKRELTLPVGEVFYPIFISDAARAVSKWIFSFGPYGKEIFLLGPKVSGAGYWSANQKIVTNISLNYNDKEEPRYVPRNFETKVMPVNLNFALLETYRWLSQPGIEKPVNIKIKKVHKYPKYFKPVMFLVFLILFFPFLMIFTSLGVIYLSYRDYLSGNESSAISKILIAKTLFVIGREQSSVFTYIPLVGRIYKEASYTSDIGQRLTDVGVFAFPLIKTADETFNKVLGDSIYDPTTASKEIADGMDKLYQDTEAIRTQTLIAGDSGTLLARLVLKKINFDIVKNFISQGRVLAANLPSLLGKDQRKTYLVLFQNNMELRPTGGFIGSFGLLTFDGGRMTDLTVNDVYSADGQLRGHVEPPTPIRDYLNEANWWLRDSNWDPDFPTSAKRAEWFLDKELSQQVDGAMAIDLKTVSEILKISGPVFLADYNLDITSDNLYDKTQAEAQDKSFPGSHQKASFLTALSRNLLVEVERLNNKQKLGVLGSFFRNFNRRHIQAFMHDEVTQNAVASLGWSGEVTQPSCGKDCYTDFVGLVEANFGVNKANYFITRNVDLKINLDRDAITRELTLTLINSANQALGPSGTYKVYIRTFIPDGSNLLGVKAISGDSEESLLSTVVESHGRQEVGVFVQVLGGQSKKIKFTWASSSQNKLNLGSYGLYIRKQAGVSDDPWNIKIDTGNPALTKGDVYTYNTVLAQDYFLRLSR